MLPALLRFTLESFWYLSYQAYPGSNAHRFLKSDTIHKAKKNAFKMLAASLIGESSKFEVNWVFYFSSVCHREPIKRPPDEADPAQLAETVKVSFFYSCLLAGEFGCSKKGRLWLEPRWTDSSETTNIQEILVGSGKRRRKSWRNNRLLVKNYVTHLHGERNDVRDHSKFPHAQEHHEGQKGFGTQRQAKIRFVCIWISRNEVLATNIRMKLLTEISNSKTENFFKMEECSRRSGNRAWEKIRNTNKCAKEICLRLNSTKRASSYQAEGNCPNWQHCLWLVRRTRDQPFT